MTTTTTEAESLLLHPGAHLLPYTQADWLYRLLLMTGRAERCRVTHMTIASLTVQESLSQDAATRLHQESLSTQKSVATLTKTAYRLHVSHTVQTMSLRLELRLPVQVATVGLLLRWLHPLARQLQLLSRSQHMPEHHWHHLPVHEVTWRPPDLLGVGLHHVDAVASVAIEVALAAEEGLVATLRREVALLHAGEVASEETLVDEATMVALEAATRVAEVSSRMVVVGLRVAEVVRHQASVAMRVSAVSLLARHLDLVAPSRKHLHLLSAKVATRQPRHTHVANASERTANQCQRHQPDRKLNRAASAHRPLDRLTIASAKAGANPRFTQLSPTCRK